MKKITTNMTMSDVFKATHKVSCVHNLVQKQLIYIVDWLVFLMNINFYYWKVFVMYVRHFSGTSYRDKTNEQDKLVQAFGLKAYNQVSLTEKKKICTLHWHKS